MKYTKYSKYAPDAAEDIDLQELMSRLSDFFLQSGYESQFGIYEMDPERSREKMMDELREAHLGTPRRRRVRVVAGALCSILGPPPPPHRVHAGRDCSIG